MRKIKTFRLGWPLMLILSSCSALTPHENFKAHMDFNMGSSIDEPREAGVALSKYLLSSRTLLNGNIENKYRHVRSCRYFFEYNPETRNIVGWRFEGSQPDCVIAP